ncbi:hypothetical protein FO488_05765 [Geobacter sp. FeAm09]|uniref:hypothetical protein n=1 Tax=Geobacter sp. FeAm09 TaxID=2597769 RepID=UPI0011EBAB6A|nr:hypothetical protein [Geobacter sp. FeAm09]QEM67708.1 hypothetical protein FO488_05765 [Geobacter sp. FeAm09]
MKIAIELTQAIRGIKPMYFIGRTGSVALFCLSLVIVHELISHGQTALGLYMLLGQILEKLHIHGGSEAAEHVVHIAAHGNGEH